MATANPFYRPASITSPRNNKVGSYNSAGLDGANKDRDHVGVDALTTNSSHSRLYLGFNYSPLIKFICNIVHRCAAARLVATSIEEPRRKSYNRPEQQQIP